MIISKEDRILWGSGALIVAVIAVVVWFSHDSGELRDDKLLRVPRGGARRPETHADRVAARIAMLKRMAAADPNYRCKIPLEFFGKVVDQNGQPVPGATARISLTIPDENNQREHQVTTGPDGTFQFGGCKGEFLIVHIGAPEGYKTIDSTYYGDYNYAVPGVFNFHVPDPAKPVVFKVWKSVSPEPLLQWHLTSRSLKTDGTVLWFNLQDGKPGGNCLGISVDHHSPPIDDEARDVWITYSIRAGNGGGLLETTDTPMYSAPEKGYSPLVSHDYRPKAGSNSQDEPGKFRLYFSGIDGCYSSIEAVISEGVVNHRTADGVVNNYDGEVDLMIWKNPSGSRNLEIARGKGYDPNLRPR